jgi:hypothetical protein
VVLAVALALMALVIAAAADHPASSVNRRATTGTTSTSAAPNRVTQPTNGSGSALTPDTTLTVPPATASDLINRGSSGSTAVTSGSTSIGSAAHNPAATPSPTTTTTTAPAPVTQSESNQGELSEPDDPSAVYPFVGAGPTDITATGSNSDLLSLTVSCPDGKQSQSGAGSVAVVLQQSGGNCLATLSEGENYPGIINYTLNIEPASG